MIPMYIIFAILVIGVIIFIHSVSRLSKLEGAARNLNVDIDTNIWDRGFQLSKMVKILSDMEISHDIDAPDISGFTLGTPAGMQSLTAEKLDESAKRLMAVMEEHPDLKDNNEFSECYGKFVKDRLEMTQNSLKYNKAVSAYNGYISHIPGSIAASIGKKRDMIQFTYFFTELKPNTGGNNESTGN